MEAVDNKVTKMVTDILETVEKRTSRLIELRKWLPRWLRTVTNAVEKRMPWLVEKAVMKIGAEKVRGGGEDGDSR